jgi:hypothetical protein
MGAHHFDQSDSNHKIMDEIICHFPYAVFSVAFSLIVLNFMDFIAVGKDANVLEPIWFGLFHSFHFMHITFAAVGTLLSFLKVSKNLFKGLIISAIMATGFCMLSDIIFPYVGGRLLGVSMTFHICFFHEFSNIFPFLIVGLLTGLALSRHDHGSKGVVGLWSHFAHIFISSLASSFYMVSNGFTDWASQIGYVFLVLIVAVVIPCTLSDVAAPMFLARMGKRKI